MQPQIVGVLGVVVIAYSAGSADAGRERYVDAGCPGHFVVQHDGLRLELSPAHIAGANRRASSRQDHLRGKSSVRSTKTAPTAGPHPCDSRNRARRAPAGGALPRPPAPPGPRLGEYDTAHGTALTTTLRAYLDHVGDVPSAARSLNIHLNGFRYRMRRLREVSGIDLANPDARVVAELLLRLAPGRRERATGQQPPDGKDRTATPGAEAEQPRPAAESQAASAARGAAWDSAADCGRGRGEYPAQCRHAQPA